MKIVLVLFVIRVHYVHLMNSLSLIKEVVANKSPRFVSLTYAAKGTGEVARHTIRIGASVENAYKADIRSLEKVRPSLAGVALLACDELLASFRESITKGVGNNSAYTCKDVYVSIAKGIKVHKETGEVHLTGFGRSKVTLKEGTYKTVNSAEKTIAKKKLQKNLLSGKFRQFVLPNIASAKMNGLELIFND